MNAADILREALERSGMSKSALCRDAGVSRALLDQYLKGRSQPSVAQLDRIVGAAGLTLAVRLDRRAESAPAAFAEVLRFGDLFPRKVKDPMTNLGPMWKAVAARG